jgi:hypothetical protein
LLGYRLSVIIPRKDFFKKSPPHKYQACYHEPNLNELKEVDREAPAVPEFDVGELFHG